eukprot:TRINITY_DN26800_c0_g1_i1.p1 TRINITY_DN26800_c0_g1~~TRINITY_DN26800_c0_g1_i1.p1  ORF type:complete len:663 (-),score=103.18 TRINITY_DN26800_c0_g1_i1:61-2049(-)
MLQVAAVRKLCEQNQLSHCQGLRIRCHAITQCSGLAGRCLSQQAATAAEQRISPESQSDATSKKSILRRLRRKTASDTERSRLALNLIVEKRLEIQEITVAMSALKHSRDWEGAICALQALHKQSFQPDLGWYHLALGASRRKGVAVGKSLISEMMQHSLEVHGMSCTLSISTCAAEQWVHALSMLSEMQTQRMAHQTEGCTAALTVLGLSDQWKVALQLLADMRRQQLDLDACVFNAALRSCSAGVWNATLLLLAQMHNASVEPQMYTYLIAADAFAQAPGASEQEKLLSLLAHLHQAGVTVKTEQIVAALAHVSNETSWSATRQQASSYGLELPYWPNKQRRLIIEEWSHKHRLLAKSVRDSWVKASVLKDTSRAGLANLNQALSDSIYTGVQPSFSHAGARAGYVQSRMHRASYLPRILLTPGADSARECLFNLAQCNVLCVGGGPGFSAIGLQLLGEILGWEAQINFHIVDNEIGWREVVLGLGHALNSRIQEHDQTLPILEGSAGVPSTSMHFHLGDLLAEELPPTAPAAATINLVLFEYVLLENAATLPDHSYGVVPGLLSSAQANTVFIFTDSADALWPRIASLADSLGNFQVIPLLLLDKFWLLMKKLPQGETQPDTCKAEWAKSILRMIETTPPQSRGPILNELGYAIKHFSG